MVSSSLKIEKLTRPLYFSKFKYRVKIACVGFHWARYRSVEAATAAFASWKGRMDPLTNNTWANNQPPIASLSPFFEWLAKTNKDEISVRIDTFGCSVYSNDLQLLVDFAQVMQEPDAEYTEITTETPPGVKYFVNQPSSSYRTYLKSVKIDSSFRNELYDVITQNQLTMCPALKRWFSRTTLWNSFNWLNDSFFVDYDNQSIHSLLKLRFDSAISKQFRLEKKPK